MTTAYEELVSLLYAEKDRAALEWAIGSALQLGPMKTVVIHGPPATGKTTVLNIIEKIFEGTSIVDIRDDSVAVEVGDDHLFFAVNRAVDFEELEKMADVILVSTTSRVHSPSRYFQLVNAIYEDPDEIRLIAQACAKRFNSLGPTHYDHVIPTHIPEENNQ